MRVSQVEHPFYYKYLNEPLIKKNEITNKKNNQINETDEEHQIDTGERRVRHQILPFWYHTAVL